MRLAETGAKLFAIANIAAGVVAGMGAMFLGSTLAEAIWAGS
jgi:CrcB protein